MIIYCILYNFSYKICVVHVCIVHTVSAETLPRVLESGGRAERFSAPEEEAAWAEAGPAARTPFGAPAAAPSSEAERGCSEEPGARCAPPLSTAPTPSALALALPDCEEAERMVSDGCASVDAAESRSPSSPSSSISPMYLFTSCALRSRSFRFDSIFLSSYIVLNKLTQVNCFE